MSIFKYCRKIVDPKKYPWGTELPVQPIDPIGSGEIEIDVVPKVMWELTYDSNGADAPVNIATGGTASANSDVLGQTADLAFDGDTGTYWRPDTPLYPCWLEYDFGVSNEKVVESIRTYVGNTFYAIKDIIFQAHNGTKWINLMSAIVSNTVDWHTFVFVNNTAYQRYRLFVEFGYSTLRIYLHELEFMSGNPPITPLYENNSNVTVLGAGEMVRTGYTFAGWDTISLGGGDFYSPGDTFTITDNVLLYAQWASV